MAALWARTVTVGAVACAAVLGAFWGSPAASVVAVDAPVTAALAPGESATPGMVVVLDPQGSPPEVPESLWSGVTAVSVGDCGALALKAGEVIEFRWCGGWAVPLVPEVARSGVTAIAAGGPYLALKDGEVISWGWDPFAGQVPEAARSGVTAIAARVRGFKCKMNSGYPYHAAVTGNCEKGSKGAKFATGD